MLILAIFDKTWKKERKFRKLKKKFWNNGVKTVENSENWGWVENVQGVIESFHHSWIDVFLFKVVLIFENLWYKWNIFFQCLVRKGVYLSLFRLILGRKCFVFCSYFWIVSVKTDLMDVITILPYWWDSTAKISGCDVFYF